MKWIMIFLNSVQLRWREGDDDNLPNQSKVFENFADFNSICHFENQSKKFRMASDMFKIHNNNKTYLISQNIKKCKKM